MEKSVTNKKSNRRELLKMSGMGVLGGTMANALTMGKVQAATASVNVSYASWIHGHSMQIEYPERIANMYRAGFCIHVEGWPGTSNWFHFAIPTPVIINDIRLRADSVLLNFKTGSEDAYVRHVHVYDGDVLIAEHNDINLSGVNDLVRLSIPDKPYVHLGLGISIGVEFGLKKEDHSMDFIAAGCDFIA
jgi:hypothetical protein